MVDFISIFLLFLYKYTLTFLVYFNQKHLFFKNILKTLDKLKISYYIKNVPC